MTTASRLGPLGGVRPTGGGFAAFGLACLAELVWRQLPIWDRDGPGPAFFPGILSIALVVLGVLLAIDFDHSARAADPEPDAEEGTGFVTSAKFCLLLVGTILVFPYLGGVVALSLFVLFEMLWVERARLRGSLLTAVAAFCAIWLLFVHVLAVPLPAGLLGFIR